LPRAASSSSDGQWPIAPTTPRKRAPCLASHLSRAPHFGQRGEVSSLVIGLEDCTADWATDPLRVHGSQGMPLHTRLGSLPVRLPRKLCNPAILVHPVDAVAERLGLPERIGGGHLLDEREAGNQVHEVLDDRGDAHPPGLPLVVGEHRRAGIERQEQLGEPGRLPGAAPEAAHQPPGGQEGRRVGQRLVGDQHRVAGEDAALEPEPLARAQRGGVGEEGVGRLPLGDLKTRASQALRVERASWSPGTHRRAATRPMQHGAHAPPVNEGSPAPPSASTTAAGLPARMASLGLVQAMTVYSKGHGIRLGLSIMKMRFLRALHGAGVPFHELGPAQPSYPEDGPISGYFYRHPDPVTPVCWLADEIAPAVEQAFARHQGGP
jgi:hypothetical protein